ncbi:IMP cyclohydrolase [Scatolibacter rhodanostii]|uniref:IMP cyclohydrolase n=1 Tax=Scatolibacter rhodanostii TaxID=2014781 RepID=UPI000C06883F|nr:IMP cyclohydrolase [Scatolibacter rhodanostii]
MQPLNIEKELSGNSYPGRGILIGKTADGTHAVIAYFIMGRSENSRNRIFVEAEGGIRTEAFDPSKLEDPSLIIYAPVRVLANEVIVTNGDQTDTIYNYREKGLSFTESLRTRTFEPDEPNYTPRISGILDFEKNDFSYKMSILKSTDGNADAVQRFFYEYVPVNGLAHFIHTYQCDGNPRIPSFQGEPKAVTLAEDSIEVFTEKLWSSLDQDNKVSLFVRYINLQSGKEETRIINKNQ